MLLGRNCEITTSAQEIANLLQDQFLSVFSDPNSPSVKDPEFVNPSLEDPFDDESLSFTDADILEAIKEIKNDSAAGPDGIPAIVLKSCSNELCKPIRLIWEQSINTGVVPSYYKKAHVTPLYKKR